MSNSFAFAQPPARRQFVMRFVTFLISFLVLSTAQQAVAGDLRDIVGADVTSATYTFNPNWDWANHRGKSHTDPTWSAAWGDPDSLNESAAELHGMGSRVIKLWFNPVIASFYPFTSPVPDAFAFESDLTTRLKNLASSDQFPYKKLFDNPNFTTYILEILPNTPLPGMVQEFADADGFTAAEEATEKAAMKELAKYLLQTYKGSGKTFVLQNWEGDNILDYDVNHNFSKIYDPAMIDNFVRWINARQLGVTEARNEVGTYGVQVVHALEVNNVTEPRLSNQSSVLTLVAGRTQCDLYSYSAWDSVGDPATLAANLDFIQQKVPVSALFGRNDVYIGEFGFGEETDAQGDATLQATTIRLMSDTALSWGVRYLAYWNLYTNYKVAPDDPCRTNSSIICGDVSTVQTTDVRYFDGLWLVRPDGSHPPVYDYFKTLCGRGLLRIGLRSANGLYVSADNGGGGSITVDRFDLRQWETLTLLDRSGLVPSSQDSFNILSYYGNYFSAQDGGGALVLANQNHDLAWEQFVIRNAAGSTSPLSPGDSVSLQSSDAGVYYCTAPNGGGTGSVLRADARTVGPFETFQILSADTPRPICADSVSLGATSFTNAATSTTATITTSGAPVCPWTATTSDGFVSFSLTSGSGSQTLTVSLAANSGSPRTATLTIAGQSIVISQSYQGRGRAVRFLTFAPPTATAGMPLAFSASAIDANGAVITDYNGSVALSSSDGAATLPGNYVFTPTDQGMHTFAATLRNLNSQSVAATEVGGGATGASTVMVQPVPAPTSVSATFDGTGAVTVHWTGSSAATGYEIYRFTNVYHPSASPIGTVGAVTAFTDSFPSVGGAWQGSGGTVYLYAVVTVINGVKSALSIPDYAATFTFTDPVITRLTTPVRGIHFSQLQYAVDSVRASVGLPPIWSSYTPLTGPVLSIYVSNTVAGAPPGLREALNAARSVLLLPNWSFTYSAAPNTPIHKEDIDELRSALR